MKIEPRAFAIAAGTAAALLFTLCALAVAIAPGPTTAFAGYIVHLDLSGLHRTLTLGSYIGGLITWTLGTALTFGFTAIVYNRLIAPAPAAQAGVGSPAVTQRA